MIHTPLFIQCYDLYLWLLDRTQKMDQYQPIAASLIEQSRLLLEAITLGLQGFDRDLRIRDADEALALLRLYGKLAEEKKLLTETQYHHLVGELDEIGRQIGGWLRSLEGDEMEDDLL